LSSAPLEPTDSVPMGQEVAYNTNDSDDAGENGDL
jgi:hypothetical protein